MDWPELCARASFASHRLVGWVYWDPAAVAEYSALGFGDGGPYYINSRCAPLVPAGPQVVAAACYTILPLFVELAMSLVPGPEGLAEVVAIRDRAVLRGLTELAPEATDGLAALAPDLWRAVDALPVAGRAMFAAHRQQARPAEPLLSAWHAVNTLREWRGDTHFAVLAAEGIDPVEAGILHNAHLNYPPDWIPRSRGADDTALDRAYAALAERGLAQGRAVTQGGRELRQALERRTDERCSVMWRTLGVEGTQRLIDLVEPIGDRLVKRIDDTAGPEWMPAARLPRPVAD